MLLADYRQYHGFKFKELDELVQLEFFIAYGIQCNWLDLHSLLDIVIGSSSELNQMEFFWKVLLAGLTLNESNFLVIVLILNL